MVENIIATTIGTFWGVGLLYIICRCAEIVKKQIRSQKQKGKFRG